MHADDTQRYFHLLFVKCRQKTEVGNEIAFSVYPKYGHVYYYVNACILKLNIC